MQGPSTMAPDNPHCWPQLAAPPPVAALQHGRLKPRLPRMKQAGPPPPVLAKARAADSGKPVPARTTAARARPRPGRRQLAPAPSATYLRQRSPQGPDEELARRLRVLINVFAPAFGLDPSRVHLTLSSTTQSGARSGDAITISGAVDPASIQTRQLVAPQ